MKIIKQGSVRITRVEQSKQSYPNIAKMYRIGTWNVLDNLECTIGGEKKIKIFLRDKTKPENPTILSTGDDWAAFSQDDAIKVVVKTSSFGEVILVYFNLHHMEQVLLGPDCR